MKIEFDPRKDVANQRKHGVSLSLALAFDWDLELAWVDDKFEYDELRMVGLVPYGGRIYAVSYVDRGNVRRIISLRKAGRVWEKCYARDFKDF